MKEILVERSIAAPPAAVWALCTDVDRWVDTVSAIEEVERLDDGDSFAVGLRWRETRTMFGKQATEEMEVTAVDEGTGYTTFAASHGAEYRTEIRVEPDGDGSKLSMRFRGTPTTFGAKLAAATVGRFFAGATRTAIEQDLADIAAVAEGG